MVFYHYNWNYFLWFSDLLEFIEFHHLYDGIINDRWYRRWIDGLFGGEEGEGGGDTDLLDEIKNLRSDLNEGKISLHGWNKGFKWN